MRAFYWAILAALPLVSGAQIQLNILSETEASFRLVVNDYLQNDRPVKALRLTKVPLKEHQLTFILNVRETIRFKRKLKLPAEGVYNYLLTRDFTGQWRLRLRDKLPAGFSAEEIAYSEQVYYQAPARDSLFSAAQNNTPVTTAIDAKETAPAKAESSPLEKALAAIADQKFEFEKLRMARELADRDELEAASVVTVLKQFRYDQTRLQFLETAIAKKPGLRFYKDLFAQELEYELSRNKLKEIEP